MKTDWDTTLGAFTTTPVEDGTWFLPPAPVVSTSPEAVTVSHTTPGTVVVTSPDLDGFFDVAGGYLVFEKEGETTRYGSYTGHNGDLELLGVVLTGTTSLAVDPTWTIRVRNCVVDINDVDGVWTFAPTASVGNDCVVTLQLKAASAGTVGSGEYARCMAGITGKFHAVDTYYKVLVAKAEAPDKYALVILCSMAGTVYVLAKTLAVPVTPLATMTLKATFEGTSIRAELSGGDMPLPLRASAVSEVLVGGLYGIGSSTANLGTEGPAPTSVAGGRWQLDSFKITELL